MMTIYGKEYYIDFDEAIEQCQIYSKPNIETEGNEESPTHEINIFKFELVKMCIDRVLDEIDSTEGTFPGLPDKSTTVSFKIAFNSLEKSNIILENDDE